MTTMIPSTTPTSTCSRSGCNEPPYSTSHYCRQHKSTYNSAYHRTKRTVERDTRSFIEVPTEFDSTRECIDTFLDLATDNPNSILIAQDIMRSKVFEWLQDSDSFYRVATSISSVADEYKPQGDWIEMSDGTKIKIYMHRNPRSSQIKSGTLQISRSAAGLVNGKIREVKQTATIYDVKGFLGQTVEDPALTMTRVRDSLLSMGLTPKSQSWHRFGAIGDALLDEYVNEYVHPKTFETPEVLHAGLQGHRMFGHTEEPTYGYDINGAYLYELYLLGGPYEQMAKHMWEARQLFRDLDPVAAKVLKLVPAAIVGKFASPASKYYNPGLAQYIYTRVQNRLKRIMKMITKMGGDVVRFHTDGGIGTNDVSMLLDIGSDLGDIRMEQYPSITMVNTGIFWAGVEHRHGSLNEGVLSEEQVLDHWRSERWDQPLQVEDYKFSVFNLEWYPEERKISSGKHIPSRCRACRANLGSPAVTLHDVVDREDDEVVYRTRG